MDELYWFAEKKSTKETKENIYLMTMVSRKPRQIGGFDVAFDKSPKRIQQIVDSAPEAKNYFSDGWTGYVDVAYPGNYFRNVHNKDDTYTVEGVNADLRHFIPVLARRSRCFPRKIENLKEIIKLFVYAYNLFGIAKSKYQKCAIHKPNSKPRHLHKYRETAFSIYDFL